MCAWRMWLPTSALSFVISGVLLVMSGMRQQASDTIQMVKVLPQHISNPSKLWKDMQALFSQWNGESGVIFPHHLERVDKATGIRYTEMKHSQLRQSQIVVNANTHQRFLITELDVSDE
jgi:hypothetical protein